MSGYTPHYVDLRFHFEEKVDEYDNTHYKELTRVTRHGINHVSEDELDYMGESFAQNDGWQEFFANDVPDVLTTGEPAEPR